MILWPFIPNHYSTRTLHCWKAFKYHINSAHSCHFQRHWDESVGHKVPFYLPVKICGPSPWASQEGSEHSLAARCKPWASPAAHVVVASNRTSGQQQHTVQNSSSKTAGFWVLATYEMGAKKRVQVSVCAPRPSQSPALCYCTRFKAFKPLFIAMVTRGSHKQGYGKSYTQVMERDLCPRAP